MPSVTVVVKLGLWKSGEECFFRSVPYTWDSLFTTTKERKNITGEQLLSQLRNCAIGLSLGETSDALYDIKDFSVKLFYEDTEADKVWLCTGEDMFNALLEYQPYKRFKVYATVRPHQTPPESSPIPTAAATISSDNAKTTTETSTATTQTTAPVVAESVSTNNSSKDLVDAVTDLLACVAVTVNAGINSANPNAVIKQANKAAKDAAKQAKKMSKEAVKQVKKASKLEAKMEAAAAPRATTETKEPPVSIPEPEPKEVSTEKKEPPVSPPEPGPKVTTDKTPPPFIHGRHTCDQCLTTPIVGKRNHAVNLPDYDLCEKCFQNYDGHEIQFAEAQLDRDIAFQDRWSRKHARFTHMRNGVRGGPNRRWGPPPHQHPHGPPPFGNHHPAHGPPFPPPPFANHHPAHGPPFPPPAFGPHHGPRCRRGPPPPCGPLGSVGDVVNDTNNAIQEDLALAEAIRRSLEDEAKTVVEADDVKEAPVMRCDEEATASVASTSEVIVEEEDTTKPKAVEEAEIVVEPCTEIVVDNDDDDTFSDCKEAHEEMLDLTTSTHDSVEGHVAEGDSEVKPSPKKEKTDSFTEDAWGDIATFVGETLDRMADAIEDLNEVDGTKIVDGEEDEDELSHTSSGSGWSVVDEEQRIARSVEALGSALFHSDFRSSEGEQVTAVSALSHDSLSTATSVPTTIRSLAVGTEVSPVQLERWALQLQQLHELGFLDDAASVDVLETLAAANIGVDSDEEVTVQQVIDAMMKDW